jgi:PAS domain S-box-containing protein
MKAPTPLKIIFVEDLPADAELAVHELRKAGLEFEYSRVDIRDDFVKALRESKPDLVISDYRMPMYNGMQALLDTRSFDPLLPFILYTGSINEETAVECMKAGANDYIIKEHMARLPFAVRESLEQARIQLEKKSAEILLKDNKNKLQSIFSAAPVGIALLVNNILTEVNDTFCKITGYYRRELIGKNCELIDSSIDECSSGGFEKFSSLSDGWSGSSETCIKCKNNNILNVFLSTALLDKADHTKGVTIMIMDITESKRAVEELQKLRKAIDSSGEAVFLTDRNGIFTFVNPGFSATYGYEASEVVGKVTPRILKSGQLPEDVYQTFWSKLSNGQEVKGELKNKRKDGSVIYIEGSANQILDEKKNIIGYLGIQREITERKLTEEALLRSEEKYRRIFENVQDLYYETSVEGIILEISPSIEILSKGQYHRNDLIGKSIYDFYSETTERGFLLKELTERGVVSDFEITLTNRDGCLVPCSISSKICFDNQQKPVKIIGSMRDITYRKHVEKELLRHRDHLEELVNERTLQLRKSMAETSDLYENAPCGYHSLDSDGIIVRINTMELKWLGYSSEELIGRRRFADLLTPDSLKVFESNFPVFLREREINNVVLEVIRKSGSTFFVSVNATAVFDSEGNLLMSRSTLFDITARKMAEEDLSKATKEAEEANKAKSEFLANMSHEIRTPMNAVLGYTELLSSTPLDQLQKSYVNSIVSSGRSLLTLINDILDLSKIEAGMLELEYDYVDTYSFFSEFERIFSLKVAEKGLRFILDISSGTPAGIYIDEARLRQIVFNLIGNAIKFTSQGKIVLEVFTENPQIGREPFESSGELIDLIIKIEDTGIGISGEMLDAVFEPFVQDRNNSHTGGTGLGLAITRRLTTLMNGSVTVQSEPGTGSIFTVRIPEIAYTRDLSHKAAGIVIDPSKILFTDATILVVDDVEHNRSYLRDALKNTNISIFEAEDGITALKVAQDVVPDLIIADISMPKMDGFQLLDHIRTNKKLQHIPVIAYSASVLNMQKEKIHKSEFDGLLIKPVRVAELYLVLMNFLPFSSTGEIQSGGLPCDIEVHSEIYNLPQLIYTLENGFRTTWMTFAVRQPIGEIREFGNNLIQLGIDHNSTMVKAYGEELIGATDSFNIEALLKLVRKYDSVVDTLKNMAKKSDIQ